jgi:hypothetical protein
MLKGTFDSHNPSTLDLPMAQRIWRAWVRAELARFATTAAKDPEVRRQRISQKLRSLALDFQKRLDLQLLPLIVRKQICLVAWGGT